MQELVKKVYTTPPLLMEVYIMNLTTYGIKMIQFAISNGLNVRSTTFPHKDVHRETWYSAKARTANQIDHVLISNRLRSAITDMLQKLIISLKYWKIWTMKIVLTIILMKNGKTLKQ